MDNLDIMLAIEEFMIEKDLNKTITVYDLLSELASADEEENDSL